MKEKFKNIGLLLLLCLLLGSVYIVFTHKPIADHLFSREAIDYSEIEDRGTLFVVTDYSPVSYFVKGDTVGGFSYDLLQIFQGYTDINIQIELESSLQKSIEGLASGKYHIIARNIPITSDLKNEVLFSNLITQNKQVLVQRKQEYNDSIPPIRSSLDLANKTLYVSKNSPVILRINNLSKEIGDTIHYIEDDVYGPDQLAMMVAEREIDFAVCDEKSARRIAASVPELDLETMIGFTHFEAWAVSKHAPVLLDTLNAWIDRAKESKNITNYTNYTIDS